MDKRIEEKGEVENYEEQIHNQPISKLDRMRVPILCNHMLKALSIYIFNSVGQTSHG